MENDEMNRDNQNNSPENNNTNENSEPKPSTSQKRIVPLAGMEFTKSVGTQSNLESVLPPELYERMMKVQRSQRQYSQLFSKLSVIINQLSERYAGRLSPDSSSAISSEGYASKNTSSGDDTYDNSSGSTTSNESVQLRHAVISNDDNDSEIDIEENEYVDKICEEEEDELDREQYQVEEEEENHQDEEENYQYEEGEEGEDGVDEENQEEEYENYISNEECIFEEDDQISTNNEFLEVKLEEGENAYEELAETEKYRAMCDKEKQSYKNEYDEDDSDNSMRKSHRKRTFSDMVYDDFFDDRQSESFSNSPSPNRIDSHEGDIINVTSLSSSPSFSTSTSIYDQDHNSFSFKPTSSQNNKQFQYESYQNKNDNMNNQYKSCTSKQNNMYSKLGTSLPKQEDINLHYQSYATEQENVPLIFKNQLLTPKEDNSHFNHKSFSRQHNEINLPDKTPLKQENNISNFAYQPSPPREKQWMQLGPNGTIIDVVEYSSISWESPSSATRKLLGFVFDIETLATHSLTGRPSPAFYGRERPSKNQLNPDKIADIVHAVQIKTGAIERDIRAAITTKCADTTKMYKIKQERINKMLM